MILELKKAWGAHGPRACDILRGLTVAFTFAWCVLFGATARADLSGQLDGRALIGIDSRYGGALNVDLWGTRGMFRPGGSFGIGALSSNDSASSRVYTPLAFSLAFLPSGDRTGFVALIRGGGYLGAQKGGLIAGGYVGGSLGLGIALGEGASLRIAAEASALLGGEHGGVFFGPSLGFGF